MVPFHADLIAILDSNGDPVAGGRVRFYYSGTTNLAPVYQDADGTQLVSASEVDLDSAGRHQPIYMDPAATIKSVIYDADGAVVRIVDPVIVGAGAQAAAESVGFEAVEGNPSDNVQDAIALNTQRLEDLGVPGVVGLAVLEAGTEEAARDAMGLGTAAAVDVIDEDSFATDSATQPPSQQSVKAYHAANTALTKAYASADQTITSGGTITLTHGLGMAPKVISYSLTCVIDEAGYNAGDVVAVDMSNTRANTARFTGASIFIRFSDQTSCFAIGHRGTGALTDLTNANWTLTVRAFA